MLFYYMLSTLFMTLMIWNLNKCTILFGYSLSLKRSDHQNDQSGSINHAICNGFSSNTKKYMLLYFTVENVFLLAYDKVIYIKFTK